MKKWLLIISSSLSAHSAFFTGDFTYWTAREGGLAFAYSGISGAQKHGQLHQIKFHSEPGFKAGIGAYIRDEWDIYAQYTRHTNDPKKAKVGTDPKKGSLIPAPVVQPDDAFTPIASATGQWCLRLNVIDIDIGRNTLVGEYLKLRPFLGFKGSWQRQDFDVNEMHQNQRYWGFGVRSGVNSAWYFGDMWAIVGDLALSGLWSHFETNRQDSLFRTRSDVYTLKGVFEWVIGFKWMSKHVAIQAGWENQLWQNHNHFIYVTDHMDGDLVLQGLTIRGRFDF